MRVLKPVLRQLYRHPFRTFVYDDQRAWKGYQLLIGSMHLAREIERTTDSEKIGFMLPTSGMSPMAIIATWLLGRTCVPINYLLKEDDRDYILDDAEIDTVITVSAMTERFGAMPSGVRSMLLEEVSFNGIPPFRSAPSLPDDHLSLLLYTSGTSGRPKGVMLSSGNLASNIEQCIEWADFRPGDCMLGVLPQFHTFGFTVLTLLPLSIGSLVIYTAQFKPKQIARHCIHHRPTIFVGIPSMLNALLSTRSITNETFSSLRYIISGGEPLPDIVSEQWHERFGSRISEGYGLTETSPASNLCLPQEWRHGSVGRPLPRVEQKIVDPSGKRLQTGQDGEICMKGPNIMQGYYRLPDDTAAVMDDEGFFHSGDMGQIDSDGFLYITGRIKEMMIIAGENVFPREIEEVLNAHPSVHDSAVIGVIDQSRGETPLAFVECETDQDFDEKALRSFCREKLAQFKIPREIRLIETLPRNPTGKIMRRALTMESAVP